MERICNFFVLVLLSDAIVSTIVFSKHGKYKIYNHAFFQNVTEEQYKIRPIFVLVQALIAFCKISSSILLISNVLVSNYTVSISWPGYIFHS